MVKTYLQSALKNQKMDQFETGDLVKFEADIHPIIFHYGIIEKVGNDLFIYHNQATFKNKFGGGLVREDFKEYAKGRHIVSVEKTGLDRNHLKEMTELLKKNRYHWVNNNCEHFVNYFRNTKFISPTVGNVSISILVGLSVIYLLKK